MLGVSYISELQSTSRVRDLVTDANSLSATKFKPRIVWFMGPTSYHKIPFCAAEQLCVDQPLDLGLGEGGLEI